MLLQRFLSFSGIAICFDHFPCHHTYHTHGMCINIRESVESLCRDGADVQYMQYLSKSRIIH